MSSELQEVPENASTDVTLAVMANNMKHMGDDVAAIKEDLKGKFVTREKHDSLAERVKLIQSIVFGMIGVIVLAFFSAVVNFFINRGGN